MKPKNEMAHPNPKPRGAKPKLEILALRAGFGKAKGWENKIREPLRPPRVLGMEDKVQKRREQEELAMGIAAAAAAKPAEVPISFEPQHSALPVRRCVPYALSPEPHTSHPEAHNLQVGPVL